MASTAPHPEQPAQPPPAGLSPQWSWQSQIPRFISRRTANTASAATTSPTTTVAGVISKDNNMGFYLS